jgi:inorganic pyrophosphatase
MMHLWHDVDPGTEDEVNVIVEINKGSKNKYEIDKESGLIALDRVAYTTQDFPFDYGFIPQTYWDDKDPMDAVLLTTYPLIPGLLVKTRPIGIINMIDSGDADDKLICVPTDDPRFADIVDIEDINKHTLKEMEHFYTTYKKLQNKEVVISGFKGAVEAKKAFLRGVALYKEKIKK